ncbi:MAG: OmpA family protein, partial [Proteobacteria bacterium]|nr:OmpA family protein [Pseudomonadota bacterium]
GDTDGCDDCINTGANNSGGDTDNDGLDTDEDGLCNGGDPDDDNDGVADGDDDDPLDPNDCRDVDTDGCDDCINTGANNSGGDTDNDGLDTDGDGLCNGGDPDDDNDGVADGDDDDPLNPNDCRDVDTDGCDDCSITGADNSGGDTDDDGLDTDRDGLCNDGDPDDDNDGVLDEDDDDPIDPFVCLDVDADSCDDCAITGADNSGGDPNNDGLDTDGDGDCNDGDLDDDNDGVDDGDDEDPLDPLVCRDLDADKCDDCINTGADNSGGDPDGDGFDFDGDGLCNDGDPDDDNDGALDENDTDDGDPTVCSDVDSDTCDDCSTGTFDPANDGPDLDEDGLCNDGDPDDDGDDVEDDDDVEPEDPNECTDEDGDGCDDCTNGENDPSNDGEDLDGDGLCDTGDDDKDGDGVSDEDDEDPLDPFVCSDDDKDTCDDCSGGTYDPSSDGDDFDQDGLCDDGDPYPYTGMTISGGACSVGSVGHSPPTPFGIAMFLLALIAIAVRSGLRKKKSTIQLFLITTVILVSSVAEADKTTVDVHNFKPSPFMNDLFNISLGDTRDLKLQGDVGLYLDYQHDPLVLRIKSPDTVIRYVVENQLVGDLLGAFSIMPWLDVGLALPVVLYQNGEGFVDQGSPGSFSVGDLRLHVKGRLFRTEDKLFSVSLAPYITFPTGKLVDHFSGSEGVTFVPQVAAGFNFWEHGGVALDLGYRMVKNEQIADLNLHDELLVRLGGWVPIPIFPQKFLAIAEVITATTASDPFDDINQWPFEIDLGLRYFPAPWIHVNLGSGFGVTKGYATPDFRIFAGVVMTIPRHQPQPKDTDGDGLLDPDDQCPLEPEDKDGFEDEEGCPDPDNDQDGILDINDKCPLEPEDKDTFEDQDGCPDPDNDQDGILDVNDKCPLEPEDKDTFEDQDGCPDPDNDGDKICDPWVAQSDTAKYADTCDGEDKCPDEPETINQVDDADGCPDSKVKIEKEKLIIIDKVYFVYNKAEIVEKSFPILNEVVTVLKENPTIKKIRIEGHTDTRGRAVHNKKLSASRAGAIKTYLIENGIEAERLIAKGFGESRPLITPEKSEDDYEKNRRVEFIILESGE